MNTLLQRAKRASVIPTTHSQERGTESVSKNLSIVDFNNNFSFSGGGIRTYHMRKIEYLGQRDDVSYSLIVPSDKNAVEQHGTAKIFHVKSPRIPGAEAYRHSFNPFKLERILKQVDPDLIEVGGPYVDPFLVGLVARKFDAVVTGFWHTHYPSAYFEFYGNRISPRVGRLLKQAGWYMARKTFGSYDATFAAADCVIADLKEQGIDRIIQCPLGVDTEHFHPKHYDPALRMSVGAVDRPLVFFPHRLLQEKGIRQVVEAVPAIAQNTNAVFVFAGTGPEYPLVEKLISERSDCHYLGYVESRELMARWLASSDLAYGLSAWETFGLSVIEAMASGVPIIAANEGAARDWVERARCGVTIPRTAEDVARATIDLLSRPDLRTLGRRGRQYVARHFSWGTTFERQLGYYRKLVQARRQGRSLDGYPYMLETAGFDTDTAQVAAQPAGLLSNVTPMSARRRYARKRGA